MVDSSRDATANWSDLLRVIRNEVGQVKGIRMKSVLAMFRLASFSCDGPKPGRYLLWPIKVFYKLYAEFLLGIELPAGTRIGAGLRLVHGVGLVVHKDVVIGRNCLLRQGVTLGNKGTGEDAKLLPVIEDDVEFGAGAIVIGAVRVGRHSIIGAGVVVTKDVPENSIVVSAAPRVFARTR